MDAPPGDAFPVDYAGTLVYNDWCPTLNGLGLEHLPIQHCWDEHYTDELWISVLRRTDTVQWGPPVEENDSMGRMGMASASSSNNNTSANRASERASNSEDSWAHIRSVLIGEDSVGRMGMGAASSVDTNVRTESPYILLGEDSVGRMGIGAADSMDTNARTNAPYVLVGYDSVGRMGMGAASSVDTNTRSNSNASTSEDNWTRTPYVLVGRMGLGAARSANTNTRSNSNSNTSRIGQRGITSDDNWTRIPNVLATDVDNPSSGTVMQEKRRGAMLEALQQESAREWNELSAEIAVEAGVGHHEEDVEHRTSDESSLLDWSGSVDGSVSGSVGEGVAGRMRMSFGESFGESVGESVGESSGESMHDIASESIDDGASEDSDERIGGSVEETLGNWEWPVELGEHRVWWSTASV